MRFGYLCVLLLAGCAVDPMGVKLHLRPDQVQVKEKDTIYSLAERYKVTPRAIMEANNLPSASVVPGEILIIPQPGVAYGYAGAPKPGLVDLNRGEPEIPVDAVTLEKGNLSGEESVMPAIPDNIQIEKKETDYTWPVQGSVVKPFGKGNGNIALGVVIKAEPGSAVRAARAGKVVYAGDDIPDYGYLVLIRHADGDVTAYGYVQNVLLKTEDTVGQGQVIGKVADKQGAEGLYFELRRLRKATDKVPKAINPQGFLPVA